MIMTNGHAYDRTFKQNKQIFVVITSNSTLSELTKPYITKLYLFVNPAEPMGPKQTYMNMTIGKL